MAFYKNVLLAVDFRTDNAELVEKAKAVVASNEAKLHVIHVQEPLSVAYAADAFAFNEQLASLHSAIRKEAQEHLAKLGKDLGLSEDQITLGEGKASDEIHRVAKDKDIDLIIMGTHGQKGVQLLLGSTANSVLHGVGCDVLTVRL